MNNSRIIALNTIVMYVKAFITIGFALYTTRILLNTLGEEDFGLFNLVGGIISIICLIVSSMSTASQRFMAYALGEKDEVGIRKVFNSSRYLHFLFAIFFVLSLELLYPILFNYVFNIPPERIIVAKIIYQFMVFGTFVSILNIPYDAIIIAHEHMFYIAIVWILEALIKFGIAISLIYISYDKLIVYGFFMSLIPVLTTIIKVYYCKQKFPETRIPYKGNKDVELRKKMLRYASWNLLGIINDSIGRNQGIAILLNFFFGVVSNAALAIAAQVNTQICYFSTTVVSTMTPQIVKAESAGNRDKTLYLSMLGGRISFFILSLLAIPFIAEMPYILKIWLKDELPSSVVIYCQLLIILYLVVQMFICLKLTVQAIGRIKEFQVITFLNMIFVFVIASVMFVKGYSSYWIFIIMIVSELLSSIIKLFFIHKMFNINVSVYYNQFLKFIILPISANILFISLSYYIEIDNHFIRLLFTFFVSSVIMIGTIYFYGISKEERVFVNEAVNKTVKKIYKI